MEAQAAAHAGDVDQMISAHLSRQMAEKADLVMKAAARRMRARGLTLGFNAWADFWAAKTAAMRRMREIANRLHPATTMIASAFYVWAEEASNANLAAERQLLEKQHGKLKLMLELRDKEIVRLKAAITKLLRRKRRAPTPRARGEAAPSDGAEAAGARTSVIHWLVAHTRDRAH